MKTALTILVTIAIVVSIKLVATNVFNDSDTKTVFQYTKSEYLELATKNCSENSPQSYCRCFYSQMLDKYSVKDVLKMDVESSAQGDKYKFTDEQLDIVASCL